MNRRTSQIATALILTTVALISIGCDCLVDPCHPRDCGNDGGDPTPREGDVVCLWISSDKDAYVSTGRAGEEANTNYGLHGSLAVASGPLGRKMSYVHFTPPTLPPGSQVLEARLELFHGARNGDGTSDDIRINVGRVQQAWSPLDITWSNQPFARSQPSAFTYIRLRSQAWSGTPNIASEVIDMTSSASTNHGFVVWYTDPTERQMDKGFYSNNDVRRKRDDLGLAPRLVMRVKLPAGVGSQALGLGFLPSDNDLGRLGRPVTTVDTVTTPNFPASWGVTSEG